MRMQWLLVPTLLMLAPCTLALTPRAQRVAPEFTGITRWINSPPLQMRRLHGKVVLIDFWAYSCNNCLRALPHVARWYEKYKDKGLVVIGVHTPEFSSEKNIARIRTAAARLGIRFPIAVDNDSATWNAWKNRYWPAEYLVDANGNIVMHHDGEGHYLQIENAIRRLLGLEPLARSPASKSDQTPNTPTTRK